MSTGKTVAWLFTQMIWEWHFVNKVCSLWPHTKSSKKVFPDLCLPVRVACLQADNGNLSHVATPLPYKNSRARSFQCTCVHISLEWTFLDTGAVHIQPDEQCQLIFQSALPISSLHGCLKVPLFHEVQAKATHLTAHITLGGGGVSFWGNSQRHYQCGWEGLHFVPITFWGSTQQTDMTGSQFWERNFPILVWGILGITPEEAPGFLLTCSDSNTTKIRCSRVLAPALSCQLRVKSKGLWQLPFSWRAPTRGLQSNPSGDPTSAQPQPDSMKFWKRPVSFPQGQSSGNQSWIT